CAIAWPLGAPGRLSSVRDSRYRKYASPWSVAPAPRPEHKRVRPRSERRNRKRSRRVRWFPRPAGHRLQDRSRLVFMERQVEASSILGSFTFLAKLILIDPNSTARAQKAFECWNSFAIVFGVTFRSAWNSSNKFKLN